MQRQKQTQTGRALIELALTLPIFLILLLGVAEVGNAINAYLTVFDASREAARLVVRDGPAAAADAELLVFTLTDRLGPSNVQAVVDTQPSPAGGGIVTAEVRYDYQFIFNNVPFIQQIVPQPFVLRASTVMPTATAP